jgi:eukaryotic-like serine/threonine-protein kinase
MPEQSPAESIFFAALEIRSPEERAAYLDDACGNDGELRRRVERLLSVHPQVGSFLEPAQPSAETAFYQSPAEAVGRVVAGRYKLVEEIGEGGMGTVWIAEQLQPVKRRVALKLIKAGMDSKSVLARFEAERQALAVMDHPNIAKVLDGGLTDSGRPYFVMEYVKGMPITEYCDAARMSVAERLSLFVQVCSAVQHAHQKGIIHRDLKPSNILVAPYDDQPVPKVIDFGLAKAINQSLTERTLHTAHEAVLGTPLYMSPEQVQLNNLDVDTRSDIYSLGVLLYELLTGTTPLEKKRFQEAAWEEIKRLIREEEPPRPSTRLSSSEMLPSLAAGRQIEPERLRKLLCGELDWIVLKSLEKDRTRRYETANGFSMDVQRYLAGEAVQAHPPSARYLLQKFARKHRVGLTTAAAIALLLVAGVAVSTWQAVRATKAEAAAQKANEILGSIFENLDPNEIARAERPLQVILVDKLDQAVAQLEGESIGDSLVVAAMQVKLGSSLLGLGEPAKAIALLQKARATFQTTLGPEHPDTLRSMNQLGAAYVNAGKLDLARPLLEETLKLRRSTLGPEHLDTLQSLNNLAAMHHHAGNHDLVVPFLEEILKLVKAKLGPVHPDTLRSMNNLAEAYRNAGKVDLALPLHKETLTLREASLGPEHPDTLVSMNNLAEAYRDSGRLDLALPFFIESLKSMKDRLGTEHPHTLGSMGNLARAYQAAGKLDLALPLYEETLKVRKDRLGPDHPDTLRSMNNLATAYRDAGRLDLVLPLFEDTVRLAKAKLGPEHPNTLASLGSLGKAYCDADQGEQAAETLTEFVAGRRKRSPPDDPQFAGLLAQVALDLLKCLQYAVAEELLRECLAIREKAQPDVWTTCNTRTMLGAALMGQQKYADAEPLLLAGYDGLKAREATIPELDKVRLPEAADRLIEFYTATDKPEEVNQWQAERAKYPPAAPRSE